MSPAIIVVGATGNFGPAVIAALLANKDSFSRIAALASSDKKEKYVAVEAQGVEVVYGGFAEVDSYNGFDIVISLAGNLVLGAQPKMIDAAIAAGVTHFYPSEYGADIGQEAFLGERYFRDKHITRNHLRTRAFEKPGFGFTIIMAGIFVETFALTPVFGVDKVNKKFTFYGDAENVYSFACMADTARYIVESILLPKEHGQIERQLRVPGEDSSIDKAIKLLGDVQSITYNTSYRPLKEIQDDQEKFRLEGNMVEELYASLKAIVANPAGRIPQPRDNNKFLFTQMSLRQMFESLPRTE